MFTEITEIIPKNNANSFPFLGSLVSPCIFVCHLHKKYFRWQTFVNQYFVLLCTKNVEQISGGPTLSLHTDIIIIPLFQMGIRPSASNLFAK